MRVFKIKRLELCLCLLILIFDASTAWLFSKKKELSPVIFVPGDGGSQVNARLNKNSSPHAYCLKKADWYSLWLNLEILVPLAIDCTVDNMKLHYDNLTRTTHNTQGVEISIPGWGDPFSVEWVDPTKNKVGAYFKDIAQMLVDNLNYTRKHNLFGAPYDFRKAPNELQQFFIDFKALIESAYYRNNNVSVTLITHSMGSPLALAFLQQQETSWKHKYIRRIISLAGAWAGSVKAVKVFAMGDDLDALFLNGKVLKEQQVSCPSTAWLLPSPLFWKSNEALVETPSRIYTVNQLKDYFNDIDYQVGWEMRKDTMPYTLNISPPDVELHCLYGDALQTVEKLVYTKSAIKGETPILVKGKGDGTVNSRSLRACHHWATLQDHSISNMALEGVNHMGILAHPQTLKYIKTILSN